MLLWLSSYFLRSPLLSLCWKFYTLLLLSVCLPFQETISPAMKNSRCTPWTELYMWGPTPPSVALWKRGSSLVPSATMARPWIRHEWADEATPLQWSIRDHPAAREPTSSVTTAWRLCLEQWCLLDVRWIGTEVWMVVLSKAAFRHALISGHFPENM